MPEALGDGRAWDAERGKTARARLAEHLPPGGQIDSTSGSDAAASDGEGAGIARSDEQPCRRQDERERA